MKRSGALMSTFRLSIAILSLGTFLICAQNASARVVAMSIKSNTPGPQILELPGGARIQANLPPGYRLGVLALPQRNTYLFMGADNKNGEHAVMTVDILPSTAKLSSSKAVFDGVFKAYSVGTGDFKSAMSKPLSVNGITFEKANFEGTMEGIRSKGFALVTRLAQGFCVMVGRDRETDFKQSEAKMLGIVNSCRLKSK
ncbi:MAG: hypothetical protein K2Y39_16720 [Candidatus Obscuribacterales bacterium]|nr:hypothetical protein [Candidatus Obscuribacterales bacterium]